MPSIQAHHQKGQLLVRSFTHPLMQLWRFCDRKQTQFPFFWSAESYSLSVPISLSALGVGPQADFCPGLTDQSSSQDSGYRQPANPSSSEALFTLIPPPLIENLTLKSRTLPLATQAPTPGTSPYSVSHRPSHSHGLRTPHLHDFTIHSQVPGHQSLLDLTTQAPHSSCWLSP